MLMKSVIAAGLATSAFVLANSAAFAACSGAAAPMALQSFNASPSAWLESNKGRGDIGAKAEALAAQAVNSGDSAFGKNLATVLGSASGDDGVAIGSALAGLSGSCSDPKDPSDRADKEYIAQNIERNLLTNVAANTAYGQKGGPETAATGGGSSGGGAGAGGGGGSSSGTGSIGDGLPTGGTNSGFIPDGTTATTNSIGQLATGSVGAVSGTGVTTSSTTPGYIPATYSNYAATPASFFSDPNTGTSNLGGTSNAGGLPGPSYGATTVSCSQTLVAICGNGAINGSITLNVFEASNTSISNSQIIIR